MANKQIDPDGPYMRGYQDAEDGDERPHPDFHPYRMEADQREYNNGYDDAVLAAKAPQ